MNKPYKLAETDKTFIYEVNTFGTNKWFAGVQSGFESTGVRTSQETLEQIAKLLAAAPMLYEALEGLISSFEGMLIDSKDAPMYPAYIAAKAALAAAK